MRVARPDVVAVHVNYRHGFHAGNHTEPFKHAVLLALVGMLKGKDKPFVVLDTHAGSGLYDLRSEMACRTREAEEGIERLMTCRDPALAGYLELVRDVGGDRPDIYPGSPEIVRRSLRASDRLVLCELHRDDVVTLRANMGHDPRVSVHERDGYEAAMALLPPRQRRGLVFVDPPFEAPGEAAGLGTFLARACRKWPTGVFVAWFPLKGRRIGDTILAAVQSSSAKGILAAEFLRYPIDGVRLAGSAIVVLNPPWRADEQIAEICAALHRGFGAGEWRVETLRAE